MANRIYYKIMAIAKKEEEDKKCRERQQETKKIIAIKRMERLKVLEDLQKRISKGKLNFGSGKGIEVAELMGMIDEMKDEEMSPRRFC